ncbi:MAG: polymer-forming cytoskeletal protein [Phycisphaeraceae bacterium]|nr:polymer-forming cytoskeletal protein [Phycisphaeraceae bacterium]
MSHTHIGTIGETLEGDGDRHPWEGAGDAVVEGRVTGRLFVAGRLRIAACATVAGSVTADRLSVAGRVEATVTGRRSVDILPGAVVVGDIRTPRLCVHPGAKIHGQIHMDLSPAEAEDIELADDDDDATDITCEPAEPETPAHLVDRVLEAVAVRHEQAGPVVEAVVATTTGMTGMLARLGRQAKGEPRAA